MVQHSGDRDFSSSIWVLLYIFSFTFVQMFGKYITRVEKQQVTRIIKFTSQGIWLGFGTRNTRQTLLLKAWLMDGLKRLEGLFLLPIPHYDDHFLFIFCVLVVIVLKERCLDVTFCWYNNNNNQSHFMLLVWENRKMRWVLIGGTALGLSYLLYRLLRKNPPSPPSSPRKVSLAESQEEIHLRTVHSNYSEFYFDKEEQLRLVISKISPKGPTLQQVYLLSPLIIVDEFLRYTREIRKRRRLIRKVNEDQYVNLIRAYEIDVKELLEAGRVEVLEEYGLSLDDLAKMEESYEMFEDTQTLRKKAGEVLRAKAFQQRHLRRIPREKLRRIVEEEIFFISSKMFQRLKQRMQEEDSGATQQQIYRVVLTLCDDILFEKFGYERQEIEAQLSQVPLLAKDLHKQRQSLFANLVEFNIDSLESPDEDAEVQSEPQGASCTRTIDTDEINMNSV